MGGKRTTSTPGSGGQPAAAAGIPQSFIDTLTSAIPTEPLAAYTAVIGIVTAVTDSATGNYLPFRCGAAAVFVVLTAAAVLISYRSKAAAASPPSTTPAPRWLPKRMAGQQGRPVPWPELLSAVVAAAVWGAAMPGGPLSVAFTGPAEAITTGSTAVVGAVVVSFLAGQLTKGVGLTPGGGDEGSPQIPAPPGAAQLATGAPEPLPADAGVRPQLNPTPETGDTADHLSRQSLGNI